MKLSTILFYSHSGLRWLIVAAAVAAVVFFGYSWLSKKYAAKPARILTAAYSGMLDMQVLLGLILLFTTGVIRYRLEHMGVLILAALVAHLPRKWRDSAEEIYYRNTFLTILASLVLIYIGVAILPGGWNR
jgi:hypothetical protein